MGIAIGRVGVKVDVGVVGGVSSIWEEDEEVLWPNRRRERREMILR